MRPTPCPRRFRGGWLPTIGGLDAAQIKALLTRRWASLGEPYLRQLADAILGRELVSLSIDELGSQWLSFEGGASPVHVAPPSLLPPRLRHAFPFDAIPGLEQFIKHFAGLANWALPPCPWFVPLDRCHIVRRDCDFYDWGVIGDWAGSLPLYNTGTGNFIVLSPQNRCAKWDHEVGWGHSGEDPFKDLGWSMSEMVREFVAYLALAESEACESPFYY